MTAESPLDNLSVVLVRPRYPENIGSAARAACNMGIGRLRVVAPERYDLARVMKLATHAAWPVVERIRLFASTGEALADFGYVVGTTARLGGQRDATRRPADLARRLIGIAEKNRVAVVFGPEDRGLTNEELRLCHELVNIPTADFASLNLAQAVMVICYELYAAHVQGGKRDFVPRLASRHELDGMYAQLTELLVRISYLNPENPDYWMHKLRQFFTRLQLRAREVSIIRGICRQVNWYGGKCYADGRRDALAGAPGSEPPREPEREKGEGK